MRNTSIGAYQATTEGTSGQALAQNAFLAASKSAATVKLQLPMHSLLQVF